MPIYTSDFWCNFCRALQRNFCRKCKLEAISLRVECDISCCFPKIAAKLHQVSSMFETSAISWRQIVLKSPLVVAWENRRHFTRSPLEPSQTVWVTSAEAPYWWRVSTQILVVLLIGWNFLSTNKKHYQDLGSETSSVWNFCPRYSHVVLRGLKWRPRETSAVFSGYTSLHLRFLSRAERDKNSIKKCDKNCTENRMLKRALTGFCSKLAGVFSTKVAWLCSG